MKANDIDSNLEWFIKNKRYFNIRKVELEIGCPLTSIQKYLKEERPLADKWKLELNTFINYVRYYK